MQFLFAIYSASGSITATVVGILLDENRLPDRPLGDFGRHGLHRDGKGVWYVVEFDPLRDSVKEAREKVRIAARAIRAA